jgi:hypothetical protein
LIIDRVEYLQGRFGKELPEKIEKNKKNKLNKSPVGSGKRSSKALSEFVLIFIEFS